MAELGDRPQNLQGSQRTPERKSNFFSNLLNTKMTRRKFNEGLGKAMGTLVVTPHLGTLDTAETVVGIGKKIAEKRSKAVKAPGLASPIDSSASKGHALQGEALQNKESARVESSQSLTDTLKYVNQSREFLEEHPQDIVATADVLDAQGELNQQFVIAGNKKLYKTYLDPKPDALVPYQEVISDLSTRIENPRSIVTSSDGNTIIVGGEDPMQSGNTKLLISYNGGKDWTDIPWPAGYPVSGGTIDLIRINETTYLGNNGNYEGGVGQFLIALNPQSQAVSLGKVNLETIQGVSTNAGGAKDFCVMPLDSQSNILTAVSTGTQNLQEGINIFKIDPATGQGTVENINEVTMDGQAGYRLQNFISGIGTYTDSQGHLIVITSDPVLGRLYKIDTVTKTGTSRNITRILDNKGIPNYMNGSLTIDAVGVNTDSQGNINTYLGGNYGVTTDPDSRGVFLNLETSDYFLLSPNTRSSGVFDQKHMQWKKIKGMSIYDLVARELGKATVEINPDGSPIPGAKPFYPNQGIAGIFELLNRVRVPLVFKNDTSGSW